MPDTTKTSAGKRRLPRDARVDALRGLALLMIFIDHVPGNLLSLVTLRNFGFSDAAELFVLLSGFSSMVAYGGSFDRDGVVVGLRRVLLRCVRICTCSRPCCCCWCWSWSAAWFAISASNRSTARRTSAAD